MKATLIRCRNAGRRHPDWERLYREQDAKNMPWHLSTLDPDLKTLLVSEGITDGSILDIGTGVGTQAAELHKIGFAVTGIDISASAIRSARACFPGVTFKIDDIAHTQIRSTFDYIYDRGCLHVLPPEAVPNYVQSLHHLANPGGKVFLKCFSTEEPLRDFGPERFSAAELTQLFTPYFRIKSILDTVFYCSTPYQPKALFVVLWKEKY